MVCKLNEKWLSPDRRQLFGKISLYISKESGKYFQSLKMKKKKKTQQKSQNTNIKNNFLERAHQEMLPVEQLKDD